MRAPSEQGAGIPWVFIAVLDEQHFRVLRIHASHALLLGAGFSASSGTSVVRGFLNEMRLTLEWWEEQPYRYVEFLAVSEVLDSLQKAAAAGRLQGRQADVPVGVGDDGSSARVRGGARLDGTAVLPVRITPARAILIRCPP